MGKIAVTALIENLSDITSARCGSPAAEPIRRVALEEALIDPNVLCLFMPKRLIVQLGLDPIDRWDGSRVYCAARLTVQARDCIVDVSEIGDGHAVVIRRLPLLAMDWVIDMKGHKLIGNPAHGGEQMIEAY